jgi:hypothetical protein
MLARIRKAQDNEGGFTLIELHPRLPQPEEEGR